jgi:hypothetical protein
MEIARILDELTFYERLPVEALRAADANRRALVPVFLDAIEQYLAKDADGRDDENPLFFIFHLLGSWREKSAYRPLARLLRIGTDEIEYLLGEGTTATSHRVMAAVFDGDPKPLYDVVLDPRADELVRARMCEAVAMVTLSGELAREQAARFLRASYADLEPHGDWYVWEGWGSAIAALGLSELKPLVEQAFARSLACGAWLTLEDFEEDLQHAFDHPDSPWADADEYAPWGNAIEELSTWYRFSPAYEQEMDGRLHAAGRQQSDDWDDAPALSHVPASNPYRHVGRNDPCPCGSGRKFKKCCLGRVQSEFSGSDVSRPAVFR